MVALGHQVSTPVMHCVKKKSQRSQDSMQQTDLDPVSTFAASMPPSAWPPKRPTFDITRKARSMP